MTNPDPVKAMYFAATRHAGQTYNDDVPYTVHLDSVVMVALRFGFTSPAFICACRLHDIIEDTRTSYSDVKKRFGEEVAELVYAVTNELGRNREERNKKTYGKIFAAGPDAVALKLCDRIANVEYGLANGEAAMTKMYAAEFSGFVEALYDPTALALEVLWETLARLLDRTNTLAVEAERKMLKSRLDAIEAAGAKR